MKFLVDMALSPDLAIWLRSQGHDAVHAAELVLNRAADTEILSMALDAGRVVISADLTFPDFSRWLGLLALVSSCSGAATTAKPKAWNASDAY